MVEDPQKMLLFLKDAERLKSVLRHSYCSSGRQESVAEHSWRLALMAFVMEKEFPSVDINKVIRMVLIHDLGEIIAGDTPVFPPKPHPDKSFKEREAMGILTSPLSQQKQILDLWEEYEAGVTEEAKLAKALDKIEVLMQHVECSPATLVEGEAEFGLIYAREHTDHFPFIKKLRELVDKEYRRIIEEK